MSRNSKRPRPVGGPRPSGHRVTHPRGSSRPHNGNTGAAHSEKGCALFAVLLLAGPGVVTLALVVTALALHDFTA